jgi:hypothetical protein
MGHPVVDQRTPFAFETLHVADEDGRPVVAILIKGTYDIAGDALRIAPEQQPVLFAGVFHGEPDVSSHRFEPEFAFVKPGVDVVLVGHAHARTRDQAETLVRLRLGALAKEVLVSGDRTWQSRFFGARASEPAPFEKVPLTWERAFGGWDRSHADPAKHACDPRNSVGVGFRVRGAPFAEGAPLPNLEDPDDRLTSFTGRCAPAGFGFTLPHWQPRAKLAGTYDAAWDATRKPLLPRDFDRRFFNAGAPGLVSERRLRGDEPVAVDNASPRPLRLSLPGEPPPRCRLTFRHEPDETLVPELDTVVIDADLSRVILTWRAHTTLRDGPLDVRSIVVARADDPVWSAVSVAAKP